MAVDRPFNFAVPTGESLVRSATKGLYKGPDRRKKKRITIDELNAMGDEQLRQHLQEIQRPPDKRPAIVKVLDVLDVPRNVVANVIAGLAGVKPESKERGTFGIRKVYTSDLLSKMGMKPGVARSVLGFAGDVAIDPLTYLSLGSTTGLKIGKGIPKLLKPAQGALKRLAKGEAVPEAMKALAIRTGKSRTAESVMGRLAKFIKRPVSEAPEVAKLAGRRASTIMGKRGGLLTKRLGKLATQPVSGGERAMDMLKAAREFAVKYGEKGRTIARLPFAAAGLTAPFGKRAKLAKEFAGEIPEALQKVGQYRAEQRAAMGALKGGLTGLREAKAAAKEAGKAAVGPVEDLTKKFFVTKEAAAVLKRAAKKGEAFQAAKTAATEATKKFKPVIAKASEAANVAKGKIEAAPYLPGAPLSMKLQAEEAMGKAALHQKGGPMEWLRAAKQEFFGPGASPLHQQEVGAHQRWYMRAPQARAAVSADLNRMLKPQLDDLARQGFTKPDIETWTTALIESAEKGIARHADDPILAELEMIPSAVRQKLQPVVEQYVGQTKLMRGAEEVARVAKGRKPVPGYFHRTPTEQFAKAARRQERRGFTKPYTEPRVMIERYTNEAGQVQDILSTSPEAEKLAAQGWKRTDRWYPSTQMLNEGKLGGKPIGQSLVGPEKYVAKPQQFVTDAAESLGARAASHQRRMAAADARDLAMRHGVRLTPEQFAKGDEFFGLAKPFSKPGAKSSPFYQIVGRQLEGMYFPQPVADMLDRMATFTTRADEVNDVVRGTDWLFNKWKGFALMHPAYIARNVVQNFIGGAMQGVNPLRVGKNSASKEVRAMALAAEKGGDLAGDILIGGRRVPLTMLFDDARRYNLVNAGFASQMFYPDLYAKAKGMVGQAYGATFRINNRAENAMKLGTWITLMQDGMTPRQAAMKTIMAMPDLTDMSLFEREFAKRIFPWYSWMRRNGSLQLFHYLPNTPAFAASSPKIVKLVQGIATPEGGVPEDLQPDWMREQQAMQVMGDSKEGTMFLLSSWLPFEQMLQLLSVSQGPQEFFRSAISQVRPELKFAGEMGVGADIFKRRPVEPFTLDEAVRGIPKAIVGASGTPLDNLLAIRPLREARRITEMPGPLAMGVRALTGGAFQPISKERGLMSESIRLREEAQKLRSQINRALQVNDKAAAESLTRQWMQVMARLHQLGLPGVAKKTAKTLGAAGVPAGAPAFE